MSFSYLNKSLILPVIENRQLPARNLWKSEIVRTGSVQLLFVLFSIRRAVERRESIISFFSPVHARLIGKRFTIETEREATSFANFTSDLKLTVMIVKRMFNNG